MKITIIYILLLFSLSASSVTTAQNLSRLQCERINTPFDSNTNLWSYYFKGQISLSQELDLVMIASVAPDYFPIFYFYNATLKIWTKKQLDSNRWIFVDDKFSIGFNKVSGAGYQGKTDSIYVGPKWVFNYGDSVFWDSSIQEPFPYTERTTFLGSCDVSPEVSYYGITTYSAGRVLSMDGGQPITPTNSYLYKRFYNNGSPVFTTILDLSGGNRAYPEGAQLYDNSLSFRVIDDETIVASVYHNHYVPSAFINFTDKYNLLTTNSGITWTRSPYNPKLPEKNADGQWFIRQDPATTYLYYSERHGITPKQPIYYGFIDPYIKNVTISSEYANGTKGYYGLCNNASDTAEKDKFLIYSITNLGKLQKFIVFDTTFEYPKVASADSLVYDKQILYADDTLMYVQLSTKKIVKRAGDKDTTYYSQPQVYKIHLPNQTNGVEEQLQSTTLQLYPNPAEQILRWNLYIGKATITDALGLEVVSVPASSMQADISDLAIGVYYLTIRSGGESVTRMFTVMR